MGIIKWLKRVISMCNRTSWNEARTWLDTTSVWDPPHIHYENLLREIERLLPQREFLRILVPGMGRGRVIRDLILLFKKLPKSKGVKEIEIIGVEPNENSIKAFEGWLAKVGGKSIRPRIEINKEWELMGVEGIKIKLILLPQTIQQYLKENIESNSVDMIFCLLFFHYIPHCWLSVLKELYKRLPEDGLIVIDEIRGVDEESQKKLEYMDAHPEIMTDPIFLENPGLELIHHKRLEEEGILWISVVKGTDNRVLRECLSPLFEEKKEIRESIGKVTLQKEHLPWWWGRKLSEPVSSPFGEAKVEINNVEYFFYLYKGKKFEVGEDYWELCKDKIITKMLTNLTHILPFVEKTFKFSNAESFVNVSIQRIALLCLASCGLFPYDTKVTSITIASASTPTGLRIPPLQAISFLISAPAGQETETVGTWLANYHIFADILGKPVSEPFIASGKKFYLSLDSKEEPGKVKPGEKKRMEVQKFPGEYRIKIPELKLELDSELKDCIKQLYEKNIDKVRWLMDWRMLNLELEKRIEPGDGKDLLKEIVGKLEEEAKKYPLPEDFKNEIEVNEKQLICLNIPLQRFKNMMFHPLPAFIRKIEDEKQASNSYNVGSLIEIIITYEEGGEEEAEKIVDVTKKLLSRFNDLYLSLQWVKLSREQSIRSAVAAVMGRNMSHNIGSHIIFYLLMEKLEDIFSRFIINEKKDSINKEDMENFAKIFGDVKGILDNTKKAIEKSDNIETLQKGIIGELKEIVQNIQGKDLRWELLSWVEDVKEFLRYLQHRMDFVALASTEWQRWSLGIWFVQELMKDFLCQRHLLDGIARSEGLKGYYYDYKIFPPLEGNNYGNIKFKVKVWDKEEKRFKILINDNQITGGEQVDIPKCDIPVAIPAGVVGKHAFYLILENIIRNSAKHEYASQKNSVEDLKITIEISDSPHKEDELWLVRIYTNVGKKDCQDCSEKVRKKCQAINGNRKIVIDDTVEGPNDGVVAYLNKCFREGLIDEAGELVRRHLGLGEMKIAAAFLQGRDMQDLAKAGDAITGKGEEKEDFIIRAICYREENSSQRTLGYEFYLLKPREVGIVGNLEELLKSAQPNGAKKE